MHVPLARGLPERCSSEFCGLETSGAALGCGGQVFDEGIDSGLRRVEQFRRLSGVRLEVVR